MAWPAPVIEELRRERHRLHSASFLACVATQGIAVLAAASGEQLLAWAALGVFCLGAALYVEVLWRFDARQVRIGAGDHWVAAGTAAISALAAGYASLVVAEVRWPRLHYDVRRRATVFPLAMSAAACMSVAATAGIGWLSTLGEILLGVAVAARLILVGHLVVLTQRGN